MLQCPKFSEFYHVDHPAAHEVSYDNEDMFLVNDSAEFQGKLVTKSQYKSIKASDNFKGMRAADFCVQNALAAGVKPSPVSIVGDNFSMMEDIDRAVKAYESANVNVEPKSE